MRTVASGTTVLLRSGLSRNSTGPGSPSRKLDEHGRPVRQLVDIQT